MTWLPLRHSLESISQRPKPIFLAGLANWLPLGVKIPAIDLNRYLP